MPEIKENKITEESIESESPRKDKSYDPQSIEKSGRKNGKRTSCTAP